MPTGTKQSFYYYNYKQTLNTDRQDYYILFSSYYNITIIPTSLFSKTIGLFFL